MGPFPKLKNYEYILVAVDYVSKSIEAMPCKAVDARNSKKMFEETIFPRFGVPTMVISDELTSLTRIFTITFQSMGSVTMLLLHPPLDKWPSRNIK